jgi:hypothetical protein
MLLKSLPSPEKHLKKQLLVCGEQVIWPEKRLDEWRPPSLCFNLTHTQSLLMCAVTQKAEVSLVFLDLEYWDQPFCVECVICKTCLNSLETNCILQNLTVLLSVGTA